MNEAFYLLVPLAFVLGAGLSYFYLRRSTTSSKSPNLSADYYKGINYLLNEKPDKALAIFLRLVEVDGDTVETHMTLGKLFRRRGEIENAIRVHQNLIARPNLSSSDRSFAMLELGKDYQSAGVLDRAEGLFRDVYTTGVYQDKALSALLDIYVQEQDWQQAIDTARAYEKQTGQRQNKLIAHYYCELAKLERNHGNKEAQRALLNHAKQQDSQSLRTHYMLAELAVSEGDCNEAIPLYIRVIELDERFASFILPKMQKCLSQVKDKRIQRQIDQLFIDLRKKEVYLSPLTRQIQEREGIQAAKQFLESILDSNPSLEPLKDWFSMHPVSVDTPSAAAQIEKLECLSHDYQCEDCGYNSRRIQWHCPSCSHWGSIIPTNQ